MKLRSEIRDAPATYGLVASWIITYLLMNAWQGGFHSEGEWFTGFGAIRTDTTHLFGDLTWRDFSHGQVWRVVTATFVHYSFTHLLLNAIGMIQLGRMMEEWYGSRQFLTISIAVGSLGNVFGVLMRQAGDFLVLWIQAHGMGRILPKLLVEATVPGQAPLIPSAGGSTIILGLIGLGFIVGWRSRTRVGLFLRDQMFGFLVFTAIIGIFCMKFMDNYGHAGGAIAGIGAGFLHRRFVRTAPHGLARKLIAAGTAIALLVCVGCQITVDRREIAEAHREILRREAIHDYNLCGQTMEGLRRLTIEFDWIAYQRLGQETASVNTPASASFAIAIDLSPIATFNNSMTARLVVPWHPKGPLPRELRAFSQGLATLIEQRSTLGSQIDGPEFDEIIALGTAIEQGPIDSKAMYTFRLACLTLAKRASTIRDALLTEFKESTPSPSATVPVVQPRTD